MIFLIVPPAYFNFESAVLAMASPVLEYFKIVIILRVIIDEIRNILTITLINVRHVTKLP